MKTLYTIALLLLAGTLLGQQSADEILASNDVNTGKTAQTLLASQFRDMDVATLDGVYKLLSENGTLSEVRTFEAGKMDGTWLQYDENENQRCCCSVSAMRCRASGLSVSSPAGTGRCRGRPGCPLGRPRTAARLRASARRSAVTPRSCRRRGR